MQLIGRNNLSAYARKMLIDGLVIETNYEHLDKIAHEINKIGVNINQVVKKINSTDYVPKEDAEILKRYMKEIWQLLKSIR